jgi:hypothetical protein
MDDYRMTNRNGSGKKQVGTKLEILFCFAWRN